MNKSFERSLSGLIFCAVTLAAFLWNDFLFTAYMLFAMIVMMTEFYNMTVGKKYKATRRFAFVSGMLGYALVYFYAKGEVPVGAIALSLVGLTATMTSALKTMNRDNFRDFAYIACGLLWIALPISLSPLVIFSPEGEFSGKTIMSILGIVWASDTGAYCFGMALGQKFGGRLCPSISPKKSWIGYWGGLVSSMVCAAVLDYLGVLETGVWAALGLGIVVHVSGVFGDLFESMWKRSSDIKDSGNIIPGHGGLLDRFDSSLFAIPCGALYLYCIASIF